MVAYYSFSREQDTDDSYIYTFVTDSNSIYIVNFDVSGYKEYLEEHPLLLEHGYTLGIFRNSKSNADPRVRSTVFKIIIDHFAIRGKESVILYHCDIYDGKQRIRNALFDKWHKECESAKHFVKETLEVEIFDKDGCPVSFYIGFVTANNNPNLEKLRAEFEMFSVTMVAGELNKNGL